MSRDRAIKSFNLEAWDNKGTRNSGSDCKYMREDRQLLTGSYKPARNRALVLSQICGLKLGQKGNYSRNLKTCTVLALLLAANTALEKPFAIMPKCLKLN